jgi:hypothetical protein
MYSTWKFSSMFCLSVWFSEFVARRLTKVNIINAMDPEMLQYPIKWLSLVKT